MASSELGACNVLLTPAKRNPKISLPGLEIERVWHYTDNGCIHAVQQNRPADNRWIGTKTALPQCVTQNDDVIVTVPGFFRSEGTTELRRHSEHIKEIA